MQNTITPQDDLITTVVTSLDESLREEFEERAAIIEFDGKLPRAHAESLALIDVLLRHPSAITGVTVLQYELNGGSYWWLATNPNLARQYLASVGGKEVEAPQLGRLLNEQYGGIAVLTPLE